MHFRLYPLRFTFRAEATLRFPPGVPANLLRGALGTVLRQQTTCAYARIFEPSPLKPQASGFSNPPRPFVFRAAHLDGVTVAPGESFFFDLNVFDMQTPAVSHLTEAFRLLAEYGLGPARTPVILTGVSHLNGTATQPLALSLDSDSRDITRVRVTFVSPTELKSAERVIDQPEFKVLAGRIRDRLSHLRELYDCGPLELDFQAFGERSVGVTMTHCDIRHVGAVRRSSRTGQVHNIGGFVGVAEYQGRLTEFLPYLRAAKWIGVGRQTAWGKGELAVEDYFSTGIPDD